MTTDLIESLDGLEASAEPWDDLWRRCDLASPTFQAKPIACWVGQFAPGASFRALVVRNGDRMVAALPLVLRGRFGFTTTHAWSNCGELLIDPDADRASIATGLVEGLRGLSCALLLLRFVRVESPGWQALVQAVAQAGGAAFAHRTHEVGRVRLPADFEAYLASLSSNHRRHMRKAERRIEREGGAELRILDRLAPEEVRPRLEEGFAVEDRSWKGEAGTSVLRTPGMLDYYVRQAEILAARNQLRLAFLDHLGKPIAFIQGWWAKNTFLTPKIGYDASFAEYSPGQVLFHRMFQAQASLPEPGVVDFDGPLAESTRQWTTETYAVGHAILSCRRVTGKGWVGGYRLLRSAKQRWNRHR